MPCGQLDKRRGGHRCSSCRKSHMKCDGNNPCSFCRRNGLECSYPQRSRDVQIVRVFQSPFGSPPPKPKPALTNDTWSFVNQFFEATGKLPQSEVLRCPEVVTLSQSDELVNKTITVVGHVFSSTNTHTMESKMRNSLRRLVAAQKRIITQRMARPYSENTTVLLLCSLLLAVPDLLLNPTAESWRLWIIHVRNFTNYMVEEGKDLSKLDGELMRFFQLNDLLGSIPFSQRPVGQDFAARLQREATTSDQPKDPASERPNQVLSLMWRWAVFQERLHQWNLLSADPDNRDPNHGLEGIEIICEASSLQASMLQALLSDSAASPSTTQDDSYSQYMRWALICLSQQLQASALTSLQCELPVMTPECLHDQAIDLMEGIEALTAQSLLDVAFFLPLAEAVAPVVEEEDDRTRLFRFLDTVKQRGFGVADEYRREIQEEWDQASIYNSSAYIGSPKIVKL
ncbi:unnamed protein product [Clonostachys rosea]|uniref:Zn(2)-C6 fungal-type domain-containing protein n=1 Tax=Bionectria ochroleuca TaxID=29856 RepID=A0ABY6URB9_BIOOC|nr:unnamed protein product [Clonostachys rosea]